MSISSASEPRAIARLPCLRSGWRAQLAAVRMARRANAISMASCSTRKATAICGRIAYTTIFPGQLTTHICGLPDKPPASKLGNRRWSAVPGVDAEAVGEVEDDRHDGA